VTFGLVKFELYLPSKWMYQVWSSQQIGAPEIDIGSCEHVVFKPRNWMVSLQGTIIRY